MGTLGVITHLSLKVLPLAPAEATLVFKLGQHDALEQLHRWGGQPLPLNASCWVKDETAPDQPELLFVRLRGAVAAVEAACERMTREALLLSEFQPGEPPRPCLSGAAAESSGCSRARKAS